MPLGDLLDKIVDASEELSNQSIDYTKQSSLVSVLYKLIDCYKLKCQESSNEELDAICWQILFKGHNSIAGETTIILNELYAVTVGQLNENIKDSSKEQEENKVLL